MNKQNKIFFWAVVAVVTIGMAFRLFGFNPNVSPMLAVLIFGAAYLHSKGMSLIYPIALYFLSDLYLNNVVYADYFEGFQLIGSLGVYASFLIIIPLAILFFRKVTIPRVLIGSLGTAIIFFLVTNFNSMLADPMYTKDFAGLMQSYENAIPFFRSTLVSTMVYSAVFFTAAELVLRQPELKSKSVTSTAK